MKNSAPLPPKPFSKKPPSMIQDKMQVRSQQLENTPDDSTGESVKVALRLRPLNELQLNRNDQHCIKVQPNNSIQIGHKGIIKNFRFNTVMGQNETQDKVYEDLSITNFIDSALQGYSATIFAYGQTGSGKTYTMAGKQQIYSQDIYRRDPSQGIIPRAIHDLWSKISKNKSSTFFIKASYTQIYNQQVKDLLNLSSGVLHCRWNPASGFFVQDLVVVDCTNVDDMIAVLHEGMQNRKSASHELNKDSSRSHSILTMYMISEVKSGSQTFKKYGKLSFVDLAGSERLKESKSQGEMIKETGNINKSLFTLGKVIKGLSDKKSKTLYIPYRDSKLTMLLMDSLGGNSKALMIACASPSSVYFEQTLSTLNYAARTMNIKNKPAIQMDQKDQTIVGIQREIELLRKQNVFLREQYQRVSKGLPLKLPEFGKVVMGRTVQVEGTGTGVGVKASNQQLRPLEKQKEMEMTTMIAQSADSQKMKDQANAIIIEYQIKFDALKKQNDEMRKHRDQSQNHYQQIMNNNGTLQTKLDNLQQIFLNKKKDQRPMQQLVTSSLMQQNTELKHKLFQTEKLKRELEYKTQTAGTESVGVATQLKAQNENMQKQVEYLQKRERELLEMFQKGKKRGGNG